MSATLTILILARKELSSRPLKIIGFAGNLARTMYELHPQDYHVGTVDRECIIFQRPVVPLHALLTVVSTHYVGDVSLMCEYDLIRSIMGSVFPQPPFPPQL